VALIIERQLLRTHVPTAGMPWHCSFPVHHHSLAAPMTYGAVAPVPASIPQRPEDKRPRGVGFRENSVPCGLVKCNVLGTTHKLVLGGCDG
jgi:hypothetical protein